MAYDYLCDVMSKPQKASKEYLKILNLAAKENETKVDDALRLLFESGDGDSDVIDLCPFGKCA
jgi:tRNA G26 N,N-dimethylase Trm1